MDLEERWASYRRQTFFGAVLFPLSLEVIIFEILSLVNVLPHGFSFIATLLFKTVRSLSLCREIGRGRLGCCIHMLQLWYYSHLSVIARDQSMGFVGRNRIRATMALDIAFFGDIDGWLRYLCSLSPTNWTWRVKQGVTRWQGQTHRVNLLGIPLVGIRGCKGYFPSIAMRQFRGIQHIA